MILPKTTLPRQPNLPKVRAGPEISIRTIPYEKYEERGEAIDGCRPQETYLTISILQRIKGMWQKDLARVEINMRPVVLCKMLAIRLVFPKRSPNACALFGQPLNDPTGLEDIT